MKVLWLINILIPRIAKDLGLEAKHKGGGWLTGISNELLKDPNITLYICSPQSKEKPLEIHKCEDNLYACFYPEKSGKKYDPSLQNEFVEILNQIKPDVVHCFGTEYPRTYSMVQAANKAKIPSTISITGMVGPISKKYLGKVPPKYMRKNVFRELYRLVYHSDTLKSAKKDFERRSVYEKKAISECSYVIGRTEWDKACTTQINPNIRYFKCNETLRDSFYEKQWSYGECEKHSIMVSQLAYPIKGFEVFLEGLSIIKEHYPDVKVYVPGGGAFFVKGKTKRKLSIYLSDYSNYLNHKIKELGLWDNIILIGALDETEMRDLMLKSNVFVLPSAIENSSNSLAEAMLLGVPSVASCVGGTQDLLFDRKEGYLYPYDEPYMMAHYIMKIFDDSKLAASLSENARKKANILYDRQNNCQTLKDIYAAITAAKPKNR